MPRVDEKKVQVAEHRVEERIVELLVPRVMEDLVELMPLVPREFFQQGTKTRIVDVPEERISERIWQQTCFVSHVMSDTLEQVMDFPHGRISERAKERIVDVPVQIAKETRACFTDFLQERIPEPTGEQFVDEVFS